MPGTDVSVSTAAQWGFKAILSLPPKDAVEPEIDLLDLGRQEVQGISKNVMLWLHFVGKTGSVVLISYSEVPRTPLEG